MHRDRERGISQKPADFLSFLPLFSEKVPLFLSKVPKFFKKCAVTAHRCTNKGVKIPYMPAQCSIKS